MTADAPEQRRSAMPVRSATAARVARRTLMAAGLGVILVALPVSAAYPSPPPDDFWHAGRAGHATIWSGGQIDPYLSPSGGTDSARPLLVIHVTFADATVPPLGWAAVAQRVFGRPRGVVDYFYTQSGGRFVFVPAAETWGTSDGVVSVTMPTLGSIDNPNTQADETAGYLGLGGGGKMAAAIGAADPWVRFDAFDTSPRDGSLTENELIVLVVAEDPGDSAGTTGAPAPVSVDGVTFPRPVGYTSTASSVEVWEHELAHETFHLTDLYGPGAGAFDITGNFRTLTPPCPNAAAWGSGCGRVGINAFHKMHLGWLRPQVVVRDGYYVVNAGDSSYAQNAFILYDDARGTDDYFLIENRQRTSAYDAQAPDSGLVIWRVRDSLYGDVASGGRAARPVMSIVRPDGGAIPTCSGFPNAPCNAYVGADGDAWDAADPTAGLRARDMTGLPWQPTASIFDNNFNLVSTVAGPPSNVGVFAVPASGPQMRVYFDVRGPGVLVDCGYPPTTSSVAPGRTSFIPVRVRNTGEATDTFRFSVSGPLPSGWTASAPTTLTLAPGQEATANVGVVVPASQAAGTFWLVASGTSASDRSISSACALSTSVDLLGASLAYRGPTQAATGDPVTFSALLLGAAGDVVRPVAGVRVSFTIFGESAPVDPTIDLVAGLEGGDVLEVGVEGTAADGGDGPSLGRLAGPSQTASAVTGRDGIATAQTAITLPPGTYTLVASTPQASGYAPTRASTPFTVTQRQAILTVTGDIAGQYSDPVTLSAVLRDATDGTPISPASVTFEVGGQHVDGSTDDNGMASASLVLDQHAGERHLTVAFPGNVAWAATSATVPFAVWPEGLGLAYQGPAISALGLKTLPVSVTATEDDGLVVIAGDPTRAEVTFTIRTTPGGVTAREITVPFDAAYTATADLAGLPAGEYEVLAEVTPGNGWFGGSLELPARLAVVGSSASPPPASPSHGPEPGGEASPEPTHGHEAEATLAPGIGPVPEPSTRPEPTHVAEATTHADATPHAEATPEPTRKPRKPDHEEGPKRTPKPTPRPTPKPTPRPDPLALAVETSVGAVCHEGRSHEVTLSWHVRGGHGPIDVVIRVTTPTGHTERREAHGRDGERTVAVDARDGGELEVQVTARSADGQRRERHRTPSAHACH